jgi:hypothetical protein
MWELVQVEMERRDRLGAKYSATDIFSSKLVCSDCGGFYGKKKWHSNTAYERFVYQCNSKFQKGKGKCQTPHLTEDEIKEKFIEAYNLTIEDKERIINDLNEVIELVANTKDLEIEIEKVSEEIAVVVELATREIKNNSKTTDDSNEFEQKYKALETRHEKLKTKLEEVLSEKFKKESLEIKMRALLKILRKSENEIDKWDERIWMLMVESGTVHHNKDITFKFNDGLNFKAKE